MNLQDLLQIIQPKLGYPLDPVEQIPVIDQTNGPVWVAAGPGSGKTEVLVVRVLKLIFVDNVNPKSIIVTTFTEKAARNLFDRILNYASNVFQAYPELQTQIDVHSLRIGTLHSLCNDIMLEYRYPGYENYRLLDDLEQYLFVHEHSNLVRDNTTNYLPLWQQFDYLVDRWDNITNSPGWGDRSRAPNRWRRGSASVSIFNRIVEDRIDSNRVRSQGGVWSLLADAYDDYVSNLETHRRCDFAHLQSKFLEFLNTLLGYLFVNGDGSEQHPGIVYVMVDEYQDTNPIQEAIYLKLTENHHNLCVVGDDDQALYRFRGGTVDCMVNFDRACAREWGIHQNQVNKKFLSANYRSHPDIVSYCDFYINSFPVMNLSGARVSGKPNLNSAGGISGNYPAFGYIMGRTVEATADNFASFVRDLLQHGIIQLPSQCALLMRSVKESSRNAGPFAAALRNLGIQPYNPRSKTFLQQEEIMAALGTFVSIVDPHLNALSSIGAPGIRRMVGEWIQAYQNIIPSNQALYSYVSKSVANISKPVANIASNPRNRWLRVNILEILYRILAHEPFITWENDPEISYRLGKLTTIFETYAAIPYPGILGSNRGDLRSSSTAQGEVSFKWRQNFYYSLVGLLVSEGMNDPEDEEIICPNDRFPIMTVHQAKGLEFPFVFVYGLNQLAGQESSIRLEEDLSPFRLIAPLLSFNQLQRAQQDLIRFYYVAFSRAQYALIHLVPQAHLRSNDRFGFAGQDTNMFTQFIPAI